MSTARASSNSARTSAQPRRRRVTASSRPPTCRGFFFNDTATTEIYTLSLHDALPIFSGEPYNPANTFFAGAAYTLVAPDGTQYLIDRKSTRLNSSHVANSYAVFC